MKINPKEVEQVASIEAGQTAPRLDLYVGIHKAMRAFMADTLLAAGRIDTDDDAEVAGVSQRVFDLLDFCASHLEHENTFVHTAIEARAPGASEALAHEHEEHERSIASLRVAVTQLLTLRGAARAAAALDLYRRLALFVGHNFEHMQVEETAHNAVLWAHYTDAELEEVHNTLIASIPPAEMMLTIRWMIPAMNHAERSAVLADMRWHAPAAAFTAVMDTVQVHLNDADWAKLTRSLGLPPVPGLVQA